MTAKTSAQRILENINQPQAEAVMRTEGPVLILAGAGSGKTRTIVHRIAYLIHEKNVAPWKIIALTFTNKATLEMANRTIEIAGEIAYKCIIRTYHSLGLYFLRINAHHLEYPSNFTIWDATDQKNAIEMILQSKLNKKLNKTQVRYLVNAISSYKDNLISPEELLDEEDMDEYEFGEILPELYMLYEQQKKRALTMDFGDLLYQNVKLFERNPGVLEEFHEKYHYFLIDEYQDTNRAQYVFVKQLVQRYKNICAVGDDDQAIYGWRGADVSNILGFQDDFPEAYLVKLEQNYRSTQPILDSANNVISHNMDRLEKKLWTEKSSGTPPQIMVFADPTEEAYSVAYIIRSLSKETPYRDIGVLYRSNAQSRILEEALLKTEIPYRIYGGVSFFERKEVKDTMAYFRFLVNPNDEMAFLRMISSPSRGVGDKSIEKILTFKEEYSEKNAPVNLLEVMAIIDQVTISAKGKSEIRDLREWLGHLHRKVKKVTNLPILLDEILIESGLNKKYQQEDMLLGSERLENLEEFKNSLKTFQARKPDGLLEEYLQEIALHNSPSQDNTEGDMVNLMTIHNAKGLEFDVVFILSLDEDVLPHYLSKRDGGTEEERRLFYVAITRAKNKLYLMRCETRPKKGFLQSVLPSSFLRELE